MQTVPARARTSASSVIWKNDRAATCAELDYMRKYHLARPTFPWVNINSVGGPFDIFKTYRARKSGEGFDINTKLTFEKERDVLINELA